MKFLRPDAWPWQGPPRQSTSADSIGPQLHHVRCETIPRDERKMGRRRPRELSQSGTDAELTGQDLINISSCPCNMRHSSSSVPPTFSYRLISLANTFYRNGAVAFL